MAEAGANETPPNAHVVFFDTIRGLAALSVIGSHYVLAYGLPSKSLLWKQLWTFTPLHIWWDGFAAVSLFFVLSGLVLSLKHFRTTQRPNLTHFSLRDYFISRFCRIWMPYFVIFLVHIILQKTAKVHYDIILLPPSDWILSIWKDPVSAGSIAKESVLFLPGSFNIIPQAWTLSIELILSFLVPIGILLAARSSYWLIFFALFAIQPIGASHFLFHFAAGLLIAKHFQEIQRRMETKRSLRFLSLLGGIFLYTFRYTVPVYLNRLFELKIPGPWIWILTGLGSALLLLFVMGSPRAQAILSYPWLRKIGKISYSIYLIHMAVLLCITPMFLQLLDNYSLPFLLAWFSGFGVTVGITLILAMLSYKYIEVPSMALGRRLAKSRGASSCP